jgi:hypothetical protein
MKDLMLDIETLGVRPTSVIIQIGACYFDRYTGEVGDKFTENISIKSCLEQKFTIDSNTISWWMQQENKSWGDNPKSIFEVLTTFTDFVKKAKYIWSHSTFDIPILANAYNAIDKKLPFHYRATRDIRTLTHLAGHQRNESKTDLNDKTHNALDDCVYQVEYCVKCFNKLKERKG